MTSDGDSSLRWCRTTNNIVYGCVRIIFSLLYHNIMPEHRTSRGRAKIVSTSRRMKLLSRSRSSRRRQKINSRNINQICVFSPQQPTASGAFANSLNISADYLLGSGCLIKINFDSETNKHRRSPHNTDFHHRHQPRATSRRANGKFSRVRDFFVESSSVEGDEVLRQFGAEGFTQHRLEVIVWMS